ncbi:hypothetical protein AXF42_Ash019145 [Apostasia shenzhenica]|uniref:Uncharacterized protein n=1 Tax=Apostasia shenzhenica TaxID=1088818 RepID=A0A2I0B2B9_9ASPA|nr:hypothetical protein AXF42_Ash019145 [Apostasia shenzhenica]
MFAESYLLAGNIPITEIDSAFEEKQSMENQLAFITDKEEALMNIHFQRELLESNHLFAHHTEGIRVELADKQIIQELQAATEMILTLSAIEEILRILIVRRI